MQIFILISADKYDLYLLTELHFDLLLSTCVSRFAPVWDQIIVQQGTISEFILGDLLNNCSRWEYVC